MAVKQHVSEVEERADIQPVDLEDILQTIELLKRDKSYLSIGPSLITIYETIVQCLARVHNPRETALLKRFLENVNFVRDFFKESCENLPGTLKDQVISACLKKLYVVLSKADSSEPCAAVSVILTLVEPHIVPSAVGWLLRENPGDDEALTRILCRLFTWLRYCNYTPCLTEWTITFMKGLQEQGRWEVMLAACSQVIEDLLAALVLPLFRSTIAPVIEHMLTSVLHTPILLRKILPRILRVLHQLSREGTTGSNLVRQRLIDIVSALFELFPREMEDHEDVVTCLRNMGPSVDYRNVLKCSSNMSIVRASPTGSGKVGLNNLGNTCYMNSVLQALFMTRQFYTKVINATTDGKCGPVMEQLAYLFVLLRHSHRPYISPKTILQKARPPGFTPGHYHDSSEFLVYLLDTLHEQEKQLYINATSQLQIASSSISRLNNTESGENSQNNWGHSGRFGTYKWTRSKNTKFKRFSPYDKRLVLRGGEELYDEVTSTTEESKNHQELIENSQKIEMDTDCKLDITKHLENTSSGDAPTETAMETGNIYQKPAETKKTESSDYTTITQNCFNGQMLTCYECMSCRSKSNNHDTFRDMQLAFPDNDDVKMQSGNDLYSVQWLLDYYLSKERLHGANRYSCEQCQTLCDAERSITIMGAPQNLILTLKHFRYDPVLHQRKKLSHKMLHNEKVQIAVASNDGKYFTKVFYMLYAAVVHDGINMDSGHYYTYAMDKHRHWYKFNDSVVSDASIEDLDNMNPYNTPYILFYKQIRVQEDEKETEGSPKKLKLNDSKHSLILNQVEDCDIEFEDLPLHLQNMVRHDNKCFEEEDRYNKFKTKTTNSQFRKRDDDDEPPNGCGGTSGVISDANRFIF